MRECLCLVNGAGARFEVECVRRRGSWFWDGDGVDVGCGVVLSKMRDG